MIIGTSFLADGARDHFGSAPFYWILDHPTLLDSISPDWYHGAVVVISTPILVGTIAVLEAEYPRYHFAYVPENVREHHPEDWGTQARFVVGTRSPAVRRICSDFFGTTISMSPESAEMTKHAINGFLATSIEYAHRIADIAVAHNADPFEVARGLKSDPRIGERAYLDPIGEISPHLLREVNNLKRLGNL